MYICDFLNRFKFYQKLAFNEQIYSITAFEF